MNGSEGLVWQRTNDVCLLHFCDQWEKNAQSCFLVLNFAELVEVL